MFGVVVRSWLSAPDLRGTEGVRLTVERYTPPLLLVKDEVRSVGSRDRSGLADLDERAEDSVSTAPEPS